MKVLQNIKSENIVSIDIETVRLVEKFEDLSEGFQSAWEYKNKQNGEIPDYHELSSMWEKNASLYAEFSKICAVSVSFLHEGKLYCKEFYGENEDGLLNALTTTLNNISNRSRDYRLVGHAAKYFDYPFLCKRYVINGLQIPNILDSTSLKPWEQMNLCTNELWKVGGTGSGSSLQALCNVLNIPISKVDLVGDEVGSSYYKGEFFRIGRYCSLDTIATFNVVRKFKQEVIFQFDEVEYILGYSDEEQVKEEVIEQTLLVKLYNSKQFNEEVKQELQTLVNNRESTEEDKMNMKKILLAHYQNKSDKVAVKREKEKEVEEFVNSLYV